MILVSRWVTKKIDCVFLLSCLNEGKERRQDRDEDDFFYLIVLRGIKQNKEPNNFVYPQISPLLVRGKSDDLARELPF